MLFLVGLGLGDEKDITLRGLEAIKKSSKVFLEAYTSVLGVDKSALERFYETEITIADRDLCETGAETIYGTAAKEDCCLLVVGDPLCATTHTDMVLRAKELGIEVEIIHNTSVMGASASCGLQLYNFGQCVSIPFFTEEWRPDSFYDKIAINRRGGMHTLALLDIKVKEPDFEQMARGRTVYLPPRFMTVNCALEQLLEVEGRKQEGVFSEETICVGMARLGQRGQRIVAGTMRELLRVDFGAPLHCLAIAADDCHELEMQYMRQFWVGEETPLLAEDVDDGGDESDEPPDFDL